MFILGWTKVGNMISERSGHTALLLSTGKVLIVGGRNTLHNPNAELYIPSTKSWVTVDSSSLNLVSEIATTLNNGKVLVLGSSESNPYTTSAELFDPITELWTKTGSMNLRHAYYQATLLNNGKVLVTGNIGAELYDPATGRWTITGNMTIYRKYFTTTALDNGNVLVAGGYGYDDNWDILNSTEVYNITTGRWRKTGNLVNVREHHTATKLDNGNVLIAGGVSAIFNNSYIPELYNPTTELWTTARSMNTMRLSHTATKLNNGKVMIVAGYGSGNVLSAEIYDPVLDLWESTKNASTSRFQHAASILSDSTVLVCGGIDMDAQFSVVNSTEIYA